MIKPRVSRNTLVAIASTAGVIALTAGAGLAIDLLRELAAVLVIHQSVRMVNHLRTAAAERKGVKPPTPLNLD